MFIIYLKSENLRGASILYLIYESVGVGVMCFVLGKGGGHQFCPYFYQNKMDDYPTNKG